VIHANDPPTLIARHGMVTILCVYLPALALVLRRSNEGATPRWLEEANGHACASMRRLARIAPGPPSTAKRLTVTVLAVGMAAALAAWFYQGFVS
jgi:hypothetical protein